MPEQYLQFGLSSIDSAAAATTTALLLPGGVKVHPRSLSVGGNGSRRLSIAAVFRLNFPSEAEIAREQGLKAALSWRDGKFAQ